MLLSATNSLREDHKQIRRLDKVIVKCYTDLYAGKNIPISDLEKITIIIEEFFDSIHYSREEDSYFPCVAAYDSLKEEIRALLIEHEFSRNIAKMLSTNLTAWKNGEDKREPVTRFLKTYSIYLQDHLSKEEEFFTKAEEQVLSKEEETEMYEQFQSVIAIVEKLSNMRKMIAYLEDQNWYKY